ncbi:hypothetical protein ABIF26_006479 [Bradyrhizobium elkanii]|uniref:hypothetical protein n=2 Tax=Bradyrhizobium elkanii TaxID=29448 RepID=UPI003516E451
MHNHRFMRHGSPTGGGTFYGENIRFLESLVGTTETKCIPWPFGSSAKRGYVTLDGVEGTAARAMCTIAKGKPPSPGMEAAHTCGNGHHGCVNPNHIYWATHAENHRDMVNHGVNQLGERHGMSKLTEADVRQIKKMIAARELRRVDIGAKFGVSRQAINDIASGKNWGWLTP